MGASTSERSSYWQQQVNHWKSGGLSASKFCQANKINYHRFLYWRRKLGVNDTGRPTDTSTAGFAKVRSLAAVAEDLVLSLPSGLQLKGITADNIVVVQQLLAVL